MFTCVNIPHKCKIEANRATGSPAEWWHIGDTCRWHLLSEYQSESQNKAYLSVKLFPKCTYFILCFIYPVATFGP